MSILLSTLNARYAHASLGLRYLYANMQALQTQTEIVEFTIQQSVPDILEAIIIKNPKIIGLGIYIWNINEITALVKELKVLCPEIVIILGGPEISYEYESTEIYKVTDYIISGWGDLSFHNLCQQILAGTRPREKAITGLQPKLLDIAYPYFAYTDHDLKTRTIYVEASRGCPYKCEFCLSSLDKTAWSFPLASFLLEIDNLYKRGLRQFKFVDRTFNLKKEFTSTILNFFLDKIAKKTELGLENDLFLHFELVPDHVSDELKALILKFPSGCLQFEIGIQTLNTEVQKLISRKTDLKLARENISWLSNKTKVHLHVDLIAGLPSETLESFAQGFNELWSWNPQEIQLGVLKRLKGVPIIRHTEEYAYKYSPNPPYSILENNSMDYLTINHMKRVAKYWDLIANSGRFKSSLPIILGAKPFESMWELSKWLFPKTNQTHGIALDKLLAMVFEYLMLTQAHHKDNIIKVISEDFMRTGLQGWPKYLGQAPDNWKTQIHKKKELSLPKRQVQHES